MAQLSLRVITGYLFLLASIKVLRSEMDQAHQKLVLEMASIAAKSIGKDGDLDSIVIAIKVKYTLGKSSRSKE